MTAIEEAVDKHPAAERIRVPIELPLDGTGRQILIQEVRTKLEKEEKGWKVTTEPHEGGITFILSSPPRPRPKPRDEKF